MVTVLSFQPSTHEFSAVEAAPAGTAEPELSVEALRLRVRQQELLSDFGVLALKGTPFSELLDQATRLVADGLKADFAKVLKYLPEDNRFLVCAGVGWARTLLAKPRLLPTWHPQPDTHCGPESRSFPITLISRNASARPNYLWNTAFAVR